MSTTHQINKSKPWFLAARPKTLTGAAVPIIIALSLAFNDNERQLIFLPALLCLLFALIMQIDANFINDYFDFKKGDDNEERLGPPRACAQGWITPREMEIAILITTSIAALIGLPLIFIGGLWTIYVGVVCVIMCFLYTMLFAQKGLGDLLVILFFGIIPICATYYLQCNTLPIHTILISISCGLVVDTLLLVNNIRDIDNDKKCSKRTLVVLIGRSNSIKLYLFVGILACALNLSFLPSRLFIAAFLPLLYLLPHIKNWRRLSKAAWLPQSSPMYAEEMNQLLALTSAAIMIYGLLLSISLIAESFI